MGIEMYELEQINQLGNINSELIQEKTLGEIHYKENSFPIKSFIIGSKDPTHPTLGLFGGIHGLEKIGTHLVINYLNSLLYQLTWDSSLKQLLKRSRIVSIPLINPVGMYRNQRSNGFGVDLMRNAPIDAIERPPLLVSGHRLSPLLPWYRGKKGELEEEAKILINFVKEELFQTKHAMSVDFHSGFGMRDRFWYPYAKTKNKFPREKEALRLKELLDNSHPHHIYKIGPQSKDYTTHGDLWDYLFDEHQKVKGSGSIYLPWTLEMGSWIWVKKSPLHAFSKLGYFNPIKNHRFARVMRRHHLLIDLLFKATYSMENWT